MSQRVVGRGGGEGPRVRDHLANVRTSLAWIRVSLAIMALGYSLDRLGVLEVARHLAPANPYRLSGIGTAVGGTVIAAAALVRFLGQRRAIEQAEFRTNLGADVTTVLVLGIGGLVLIGLISLVR